MNPNSDSEHNYAMNASVLHLMQFAMTHSLDELLEETLNEAEKLTGSVIGFFHFIDDEQISLNRQNWSTGTKAKFCTAEGKALHNAIAEAGVWADCAHQRKAIIHNDYASLSHRKGMPERHAAVIRLLVVPVIQGDKIQAIIGVGNKPSVYNEQHVETISLLADVAWEIAKRKRAEEEHLAHLRFLESMDRVNNALQGTTNLEQMMSDVLDVVLSIFECDRSFLMYPCDPEASAWQVPMERNRTEYPGLLALGLSMPMDEEVAATLRILLNSEGPVKFGPGTGHPIPTEVSERFRFKSFMAMALYPRVGKPWQFGVHQRSCPRAWTPEEERLLQEVGRRIEDGLTSLLAHRNLLESEARYRHIVETATEGIWMIGPDTMTTFANSRMSEMLGCSVEEMIGRPLTDFMFVEDSPDHLRKMENRQQGISESYERRFLRQDGQIVWTHVSATPIFDAEHHFNGSFAMFTDITDRKQAETKLNEQFHFLQQLLDSIPIPVYYKDKEGFYLGCNAAFEAFIGLPRRDIVGKTVYEVVPKERADKHHEVDAALHLHPGVQIYEICDIYRDGEYHDVIFNKATFFDANRCVAGTVGAMMDITSLRKAEADRKKLEAQLYQSQKMEAIGQLAGGIAHDFNNILTAINGYSELILMRMQENSPCRHFVEQVLASADRATELTNGLLAFSRRQVLHTKPVDLCEVVRGFEKMLGRLLPEDIDFRTTVADEDLIVLADKGQIEQVLMNLVTNAKDAMPRGGSLTIEVSPEIMDERFGHAHGFGEPGNYACISVKDTGHGMDEETRKRIFEPFFTTKESGKGTGLGMAILYGIIQQHNGCITVHSEKQKGTTFKIYLSRITEEIKEAQGTRAAKSPPGGTETILLAEDEMTVRELHRMILEGAGYKIIEAVDGEDALDKFLEHRAEVDILATDVVMPKINGKILYEKISKIRPDMKVLFISGYTKDVLVERGILDDDFTYITKPVKSYELLKLVRDILDRN